MPDNNSTTVESTDAATEGQNLNSDAAQANPIPKTDDAPNPEETYTKAQLTAILKRETAKAAADALKKVQDEKATAEMSELEKERAEKLTLQQERDAANVEIRDVRIDSALAIAFADPKLNARDPEALIELVKRESLEVEGKTVTGIDAEIKRLRAKHPALFFKTTADGAPHGDANTISTPGLGRLQTAYANQNK